MTEGETFQRAAFAALHAAQGLQSAILGRELEEEPELVSCGESTINVPRLEVDAGATRVDLVWKPRRGTLDAVEIASLHALADEHGGELSITGDADGVIARIGFKAGIIR